MVFVRFLVALVLGPAAGIGIFFGMSLLVKTTQVRLTDMPDRGRIDFIRPKDTDSNVETKKALPKKQNLPPPPAAPPRSTPKNQGGPKLQLNVSMPTAKPKVRMTGKMSRGTVRDREAVPVVRVNPIYPASARQRGLEGYVTISFTITPSGSVADAEVIDSKPPGPFDRAALKAVRRWRYDPKLVDGKPVARPNQKVTLTFKLDT